MNKPEVTRMTDVADRLIRTYYALKSRSDRVKMMRECLMIVRVYSEKVSGIKDL